MNADLLKTLHRLAQPGAVLVIRNYRVFGHFSSILETPTSEHTIDDDLGKALLAYVELNFVDLIAGKSTYVISVAGRAALAEAERNAVPLTTQEDTRHE